MSEVVVRDGFLPPGECELLIAAAARAADGVTGRVFISGPRTEVAVAALDPQAHEMAREATGRALEVTRAVFAEPVLYREYALIGGMSVGDRHVAHADSVRLEGQRWVPNHTPQRHRTAMIYLNTAGTDFAGGEIAFAGGPVILPSAGLLVVFGTGQDYVHEVRPVTSGVRWALSSWMTRDAAFQAVSLWGGKCDCMEGCR